MAHERWEEEHGCFDGTDRKCSRHRGGSSFIGLIFGIVSFSVTLGFKILGIVFQALFGLLSGIGSGSHHGKPASHDHKDNWNEKETFNYTVANEKEDIPDKKAEEKHSYDKNSKVREFRKPDSNKAKTEAEVSAADIRKDSEEVHNKDFYVVLFILTIIPAIVTLAMGKLSYALAIGAAGFGLMILAGIMYGIAGSFKKRAAEQELEEETEEQEEDDSVEKLIKDAFDKLFVIRKDIGRINDPETRVKAEAVCHTGEKIIGEVRTNPESLALVRKFFYYYLDAFGEIVRKYLRLSNFEESSEEIGKLVTETEKSFEDIDGIFKDLCEKLLEKDMMHLKAEINVIKNSN